jgi:hypothetical protein
MGIEEKPDGVVITTTDVHLPRRIGHAIVDAYKANSIRTMMRVHTSSV